MPYIEIRCGPDSTPLITLIKGPFPINGYLCDGKTSNERTNVFDRFVVSEQGILFQRHSSGHLSILENGTVSIIEHGSLATIHLVRVAPQDLFRCTIGQLSGISGEEVPDKSNEILLLRIKPEEMTATKSHAKPKILQEINGKIHRLRERLVEVISHTQVEIFPQSPNALSLSKETKPTDLQLTCSQNNESYRNSANLEFKFILASKDEKYPSKSVNLTPAEVLINYLITLEASRQKLYRAAGQVIADYVDRTNSEARACGCPQHLANARGLNAWYRNTPEVR